MKILLIEDEEKIADFVLHGFQLAKFDVDHISDGREGLQAINTTHYDLIILDEMLPSLSGFFILRELREKGNSVPVVMLSAKTELHDRLTGFEIGADDYVAKPFFIEELIARVRAVLSRGLVLQSATMTVDDLALDLKTRRATWRGVSALLSHREYSLLAFLMEFPGHIFSRKQILKQVWQIDFDPQSNVVDVYVRRIKQKLGRLSNEDLSPIESVRNVGYRLNTTGKM